MFRKVNLAVGLFLTLAMVPVASIADQVQITADTDVSPKGIAKIISQETTSTMPPDFLEIIVNMWAADIVSTECPALRINQAKEDAALNNISRKYSSRGYDNQDYQRHSRNLPRERMGQLTWYYLYSIGVNPDEKPSFCVVGRAQMKTQSQLGTFLLE